MKKGNLEGGGFSFEQRGVDGGWVVVGTGALIGLALVIVAFAILQMATWAGVALVVLATGATAGNLCQGLAVLMVARARARAIEQEARTRWLATMRGRNLPPG